MALMLNLLLHALTVLKVTFSALVNLGCGILGRYGESYIVHNC